jgi:hypothetical protein
LGPSNAHCRKHDYGTQSHLFFHSVTPSQSVVDSQSYYDPGSRR